MGKISIHSDGTPQGTVILDDNGKKLENVTNVTIYLEPRDVVTATVDLMMVPVIVNAEIRQWTFTCADCDKDVHHECNGKSSMASPGLPVSSLPLPSMSNPNAVNVPLPASMTICGKERTTPDGTKLVCWVNDHTSHHLHVDPHAGYAWADQYFQLDAGSLKHL